MTDVATEPRSTSTRRRSDRPRLWIVVFSGVPVVFALTWFLIQVGSQVSAPYLPTSVDLRPFALCAGLTGLNVITYAVWFSRWNVVAHAALAFSVVGYFIPILVLHQLTTLPSSTVSSYLTVVVVGFGCALLGALVGGRLASFTNWRHGRMRARLKQAATSGYVERRVFIVAWCSVVAVLVTFLYIGFAPALTADPLVAKFFRGAYGGRYQTVAPLYRFGTTAISLLTPLVAVFALLRKTSRWRIIFFACVAVMLLGLLRAPTFTGLLLALGVYFAVRGRHLLLYFGFLLGFYMVGAALYQVLSAVGFATYAGASSSGGSFLDQVSSGAPDVRDQVHFLQAWYAHPILSFGRTFFGGLIPGNYKWNPSVFSLKVVNPNQKISDIASGGLRLPAPIWGLASFGVVGVIIVSFGYGAVSGYLAGMMKAVATTTSIVEAILWQVLYSAATVVLPVFFRLSYLSILELLIITYLIFRLPKVRHQGRALAAPSNQRGRLPAGVPGTTRSPLTTVR